MFKNKNVIVYLLVLLALFANKFANAFDQGANEIVLKEALNSKQAKLEKISKSLPELAETELNSGGSVAYLHTGTDKKLAYFRFGDEFRGASTSKWEVAIAVPYDESNGFSILGDFDGLSDAANVSFNLSKVKIKDREVPQTYVDRRGQLCAKYLIESYRSEGCTDNDFQNVYLNKENKLCDALSNEECKQLAEQRNKTFDEEHSALVQNLKNSKLLEPIQAHYFGITARVGQQQFKFNDEISLKQDKVNETPWSISSYYNFLRGNTAYGVGYQIQESFIQSPELQICEPFGSALSCSNQRFGAPEQLDREILFIKMSHYSKHLNFAIQPKISYDFEEDEYGVDLPIYFLRSEKGLLTGGLNIGWQSEDDDVVAGVFIGKAFELLSN